MIRKKVLICDDEPNILESVSYVVNKLGATCLTAEDGEAALAMAKSERPDLMILDVRMPKISGNQVCQLLKSDSGTRNIHIIILTAHGQQLDRELSTNAGADDFITKPFSPRALKAKIQGILELPLVS